MRSAIPWIAAFIVAASPASSEGQMVTMVPMDDAEAPIVSFEEPVAAASADPHSIEWADGLIADDVCGGVTKVAMDLFKKFRSVVEEERNCYMGYMGNGGGIAEGDCAHGGPKFQTQYHYMVKWFNDVAPSWATIGPRQWTVYSSGYAVTHEGTIQATGGRLFVTPYPHFRSKVRVSVRKVDGLNPVTVAFCGTTRDGNAKQLWKFDINTADPADKLYTREFSNVEGLILSVYLKGHNYLRKLEYRVRGTAL